jgi:hypothetical protein
MNGLAERIRGFAEIEIEHPIRVGNHGRAAFRATDLRLRTALFFARQLVTAGLG